MPAKKESSGWVNLIFLQTIEGTYFFSIVIEVWASSVILQFINSFFFTRIVLMEAEFGPMFNQINESLTTFIDEQYNPETSVKDRFFTWWTLFATFAITRPFDFSYMEQMATSHLYQKFGEQASTAYYAETRAIISKGQEEGSIIEGSISHINQFVRCAITSVIKTHISSGNLMSDGHINWMIQICWNGIKKP